MTAKNVCLSSLPNETRSDQEIVMKRIKVRSSRITALFLLLGLSLLVLSLVLARPLVVTAAAVPVTNTDDSGMGSLRAAISSAMSGDMIVFNLPAGSTTITLTSDELLINQNLTISGPGANLLTVQRSTASGTPNFRIFDIASGSFNVTISGLTIANGREGNGGGGGILNQSGRTLTVTGCAISGNANISGAGAFGGGIDNEGTVNVINSTISGNSAGNGGGLLHHRASTLNITGCTLSTNPVTGGGSGIDISELPGTVNVTNSTLAGNTGAGGGIGNFARGTVKVTNCTISGNSDSCSIGGTGGIVNFFTGTMNVTNCTISGNSSTRGNTGGIENSSGTMNLKNTIIAQNTSRVGFPDVSGTFTSQGYNLIGNNSGATITPMTGDQIGTPAAPIDPKLGPLQDNGGPTFTQALLPGSPATDKGGAATDPVSGNPITTDQRGLPRPVDDPAIPNATGGDGSDIGAFEEQMPTGVACTLTCPANITQSNDPNQCGAVVNYPAPTTSGTCGTVTCSPLSGSFFPKGTTTVTCSEPGGASCSFTVPVNDTQNPSVTCPNNITFTTPGNNDPCGVVTYTTPTGSDNCAIQSVVCNPPSETCFPVGMTTVTCTATDTSNNTGQCTFKVTVQNPVQNACTIACPANQTASTSPGGTQCGAVVNYPAPTTTGGSCGTVTCNPPSGSFFPVGMTTVTCTTTAGPSCTFKVTVTDNTPPVFSSGCAAG